jgi:hypothetical protein
MHFAPALEWSPRTLACDGTWDCKTASRRGQLAVLQLVFQTEVLLFALEIEVLNSECEGCTGQGIGEDELVRRTLR